MPEAEDDRIAAPSLTANSDPNSNPTSETSVDQARSADPPAPGRPRSACSRRQAHALRAAREVSSDASLLEAHLDGDAQAFNELVRRHRTFLRVIALRVLENHHDADDAVQTALLRAFRSAHTYGGRSSVGAWLRTVVENTARTAARDRQRAARQWSAVGDCHDLPNTEDARADPAYQVAIQAAVREALAEIPMPWRRTFALVKVHGLSYAEAAEVLDIPIGTVRSQINRAHSARARHRAHSRSEGGNY